jgi:hypothetical protein
MLVLPNVPRCHVSTIVQTALVRNFGIWQ